MMRRGVILPAVLVTLTVGALIGTTALFFADAGRRTAAAGLDLTQVRALGWSGVQGAMAELAEQRDGLIAGEAPQLSDEWIAFETTGGRSGLFRLLPIGPAGELAVSESGKLDLNTAPEASIAQLPGLSEQLAARIVAARPLESLADLLAIEGITWEMVYGGAENGEDGATDVAAGQETAAPEGVAAMFSGAGARSLADTATVYSFDPNIQCGVDDEQWRGDRRLNLNVEFNDRLGRALDDRLGQGAGSAVEQVMGAGRSFERDGDIAATLAQFQLPVSEWPRIFDALTTSDDEYLPGRVDLNVAPVEVLGALPGLDGDIARGIVDRRESMSVASRQSVTWPVAEDLMTAEQFAEAIDHLTTRSTQWRVRVEAGLTAPGQVGIVGGMDDLASDEFGVLQMASGEHLERRVVLEAVIDVASQRPRVAFLRDVTHEQLARRLAAERAENADPEPLRQRQPAEAVDPRSDHLMDLEQTRAPARQGERPAPGPRPRPGGASDPGEAPQVDPEPEADDDAPAAVDRRRGRWRAAGSGSGGGR